MPFLKRHNNRQKRVPLASDKFYKTKRWLVEREVHLSNNPLCVVCQNFGNVVDHIKKVSADSNNFWDYDNWQTMCSSCHWAKTSHES